MKLFFILLHFTLILASGALVAALIATYKEYRPPKDKPTKVIWALTGLAAFFAASSTVFLFMLFFEFN